MTAHDCPCCLPRRREGVRREGERREGGRRAGIRRRALIGRSPRGERLPLGAPLRCWSAWPTPLPRSPEHRRPFLTRAGGRHAGLTRSWRQCGAGLAEYRGDDFTCDFVVSPLSPEPLSPPPRCPRPPGLGTPRSPPRPRGRRRPRTHAGRAVERRTSRCPRHDPRPPCRYGFAHRWDPAFDERPDLLGAVPHGSSVLSVSIPMQGGKVRHRCHTHPRVRRRSRSRPLVHAADRPAEGEGATGKSGCPAPWHSRKTRHGPHRFSYIRPRSGNSREFTELPLSTAADSSEWAASRTPGTRARGLREEFAPAYAGGTRGSHFESSYLLSSMHTCECTTRYGSTISGRMAGWMKSPDEVIHVTRSPPTRPPVNAVDTRSHDFNDHLLPSRSAFPARMSRGQASDCAACAKVNNVSATPLLRDGPMSRFWSMPDCTPQWAV